MLLTVKELRERTQRGLPELISVLQNVTGRLGSEEELAWTESLPKLSTFLSSPSLQKLHVYYEATGDVALEYQMPGAGSWADVVLLGEKNGSAAAVIIEMKNWNTRSDRPGRARGLIERMGVQELHPSDQVKGYVQYCQRFHSAVLDRQAKVAGCVLLTKDFVTGSYKAEPNVALAAEYPIFTMSKEDIEGLAPSFLLEHIDSPSPAFAVEFEKGTYRQDRGFVRQIAAQIQDTKHWAFELLDNQRRAFAICCAEADALVSRWTKGQGGRKVIVVTGPPGSGKSAVAVRLWAHLSLNEEVPDGNIVFVTTSLSQNSNWSRLFEDIGASGAKGVISKASIFHPISTHRVGALRATHGDDYLSGTSNWRENLSLLTNTGERYRDGARDQQHLVSIVDEAHGLINTEREGGVGQFGFAPTLGPQGFHIIRTSTLSVFFMDPAQGFRHRENTSIEDLRAWAQELGAGEVIEINLSGVQFRCAGSVEYVDWVEGLLEGDRAERNRILAGAWFPKSVAATATGKPSNVVPISAASPSGETYHVEGNVVSVANPHPRHRLDFRLFDDPFTMEAELRKRLDEGASGRLVSTYSREWKTGKAANPALLPDSMKDFYEQIESRGKSRTWSRVWNIIHNDDYTQFVQGPPGSPMAENPLSEVGCPFAIRGFDFDYIGVLWLEDLMWRDGRWQIDLTSVHESGVKALVTKARSNQDAYDLLLMKIGQAYRIVLTRALRGVYVWVKDEETRAHLTQSIGQ